MFLDSAFQSEFPQFCIGDVFLFRLVVDIEQTDFSFISWKNQIQGDDSGSSSFALSFGCDGHADFPEAIAQIRPYVWIL